MLGAERDAPGAQSRVCRRGETVCAWPPYTARPKYRKHSTRTNNLRDFAQQLNNEGTSDATKLVHEHWEELST